MSLSYLSMSLYGNIALISLSPNILCTSSAFPSLALLVARFCFALQACFPTYFDSVYVHDSTKEIIFSCSLLCVDDLTKDIIFSCSLLLISAASSIAPIYLIDQ
ncbi:hypothetical protein BDV97DRAFT_230644 [Delphinella strobiligena]|nr:hypothetical protein BDV97DRAFT_230644 [Delphinella strobiligena]